VPEGPFAGPFGAGVRSFSSSAMSESIAAWAAGGVGGSTAAARGGTVSCQYEGGGATDSFQADSGASAGGDGPIGEAAAAPGGAAPTPGDLGTSDAGWRCRRRRTIRRPKRAATTSPEIAATVVQLRPHGEPPDWELGGAATATAVVPVAVLPTASVTVTLSTQVVVVAVGVYARAAAPEFENPGQLPDATDQRYVNGPVPPNGVAVIVTACPCTADTGEGDTDAVGVAFTVTEDAGVGVADPPVGLPTVPVSDTVTVSTHEAVVPVGVYVTVTAPEPANPGQFPDLIDHA